jgi:hypothetical protein
METGEISKEEMAFVWAQDSVVVVDLDMVAGLVEELEPVAKKDIWLAGEVAAEEDTFMEAVAEAVMETAMVKGMVKGMVEGMVEVMVNMKESTVPADTRDAPYAIEASVVVVLPVILGSARHLEVRAVFRDEAQWAEAIIATF